MTTPANAAVIGLVVSMPLATLTNSFEISPSLFAPGWSGKYPFP